MTVDVWSVCDRLTSCKMRLIGDSFTRGKDPILRKKCFIKIKDETQKMVGKSRSPYVECSYDSHLTVHDAQLQPTGIAYQKVRLSKNRTRVGKEDNPPLRLQKEKGRNSLSKSRIKRVIPLSCIGERTGRLFVACCRTWRCTISKSDITSSQVELGLNSTDRIQNLHCQDCIFD